MPIDPNEFIQSMRTGLAEVPRVFIVVVLLGGPTVLWLLYRVAIVSPRTHRTSDQPAGPLWLCARCRSSNALIRSSCYRCGYRPGADDPVEIIDPGTLVVDIKPSPDRIPVGPGWGPFSPPGYGLPGAAHGPRVNDDGSPYEEDVEGEGGARPLEEPLQPHAWKR